MVATAIVFVRRPSTTATAVCTERSRSPHQADDDAGVQSIGSAVIDVSPGDYFELLARQSSASTKNVAADDLTWFAIEVVE